MTQSSEEGGYGEITRSDQEGRQIGPEAYGAGVQNEGALKGDRARPGPHSNFAEEDAQFANLRVRMRLLLVRDSEF